MPTYDKAITIFAPDGNLFQVQYAFEAVNRGSATVGIKGGNSVVLAVEKKTVAVLQDPRTIKKIHEIDRHIMFTFAGLQADARVLIDKARVECQSFRFNYDEEPHLEYIARFVAETQQSYT
jgi:20S proteasome subunit alpha 4